MTVLAMLYNLLIMPIQILIEYIYSFAYDFIGNPGVAIIILSLAVNLLLMPLYNRAEAIQKEEMEIEARLHDGVKHIKNTFRGDEKTMRLQAYYRQNHYSPIYVLKSSASLLLQIPFFFAAYRFLSNLELLQGISFGPIANLGRPDALLTVSGLTINLLPVIMTAINVISTILYTRGQPLRSKIQLYVLAAFFLVFLYNSPSGLVLYWTCNNLFSLCKILLNRLEERDKILKGIFFAFGVNSLFFGIVSYKTYSSVMKLHYGLVLALICFTPLIGSFLKKKVTEIKPSHFQNFTELSSDPKRFILCGIFLSVLVGLLIPSAVLKSSPQEFVNVNHFLHPLWYLMSSFLIAVGTFMIWSGVFYYLFSEKGKIIFEGILWAACAVAIVDYFFFGKNLGILDTNLKYENGLCFSNLELWINVVVVLVVAVGMIALFLKWRSLIPKVMEVMSIALVCLLLFNTTGIISSIDRIVHSTGIDQPVISLSETGQNVVVIMLDKAMGEYAPYIFNEKPELKEQFSGFTFYRNTVSFGACTNFASPALYGGYEYTPIELNTRADESLESKQNEALKIMPVLFDEAGYDVTVMNPTYAGYQWIADLSIYDDYPDIKTYNTADYFTDSEMIQTRIDHRMVNFYCYGLMKAMPVCFQSFFYGHGRYVQKSNAAFGTVQSIIGTSVSEGLYSTFMDAYNVMTNLKTMTTITKDEQGCFFMFSNDMTHDVSLLKEPEYEPRESIDNTSYDAAHRERFQVNGKTLKMETGDHYANYECNMAAMIQLGKWFDYLKEQGLYDNTKIIIVADHGNGTMQMEDLILNYEDNEDSSEINDAASFYPLLMVKDFNADTFSVSDAFMTNADVPTIATSGFTGKVVNPFTGKEINDDEKQNEQYIIASTNWDINENNGNQFMPSGWYSVRDSIWNKKNWKLIADDDVLTR